MDNINKKSHIWNQCLAPKQKAEIQQKRITREVMQNTHKKRWKGWFGMPLGGDCWGQHPKSGAWGMTLRLQEPRMRAASMWVSSTSVRVSAWPSGGALGGPGGGALADWWGAGQRWVLL